MGHGNLSDSLFTDLYQLTMAQAYRQSGHTASGTFSLFFRSLPPNRAYFVFAGLADVLEYIQRFHFSVADLGFLRSLNRFDDDFLDYLSRLRFTGGVRAMPEGTVVFANEPVIEVTAPIAEAQLLETYLVNQVTVQTMLATKAARVVQVARGKTVVDFAARRTHGTDAANKLARAGYIVGFAGTSNMQAGGLYGIPTFGTMAHSWVTAFGREIESFRAYARSFPDSSTFLVDTYDTVEGTRKAAEVAHELRHRGHALRAIRLDSGDLLDLSSRARAILDEAGLEDVDIFASGGLDEYEVDALLSAGAPIDGFGVGTKVGVSADAPWSDSVYKLVEYGGRPVGKLSSEKQTVPGPKQVYRLRDPSGGYMRDVVAHIDEPSPAPGAEPLLHDVIADGRSPTATPTIEELRDRFKRGFDALPSRHKRLASPAPYEVVTSEALRQLQSNVAREVNRRELDAR